jgi:hypothetical protein
MVSTTGETGLVIISVLVLGEVLELLPGGCSILIRVCCWGVVLVSCHKDITDHFRVGENGSEQRTIDKMDRCHLFFIFS